MSIYSAIHNGADPTTKRPIFNTRIVPSSAVRQQREHSWVWFRQGLIWRQVSQIPRGYHSHEAIGCDACLSVQKVIWFWWRTCKKKFLHGLSFQWDRLSQFSVRATEFAEKAEQNLLKCLSMDRWCDSGTPGYIWAGRALRLFYVDIAYNYLLQEQELWNVNTKYSSQQDEEEEGRNCLLGRSQHPCMPRALPPLADAGWRSPYEQLTRGEQVGDAFPE